MLVSLTLFKLVLKYRVKTITFSSYIANYYARLASLYTIILNAQ